jgi:hypothetical protein
MEIEDGIALLASLVHGRPDLGSERLVSALTALGLDRQSAQRLVVFVPLALGRVLLGGLGITFADTYLRATDPDPQARHRLADVPEFVAASAAAHRLPADQLSALALRSPEVDAVNKALHGGSRPDDLVLGPTIMT